MRLLIYLFHNNRRNLQGRGSMSNFQEKIQQTTDQLYPHPKPTTLNKSHITTLQVTLNSHKTHLRSQQFQTSALKQKLAELDDHADQYTIAHQYLTAESDEWTLKNTEALCFKKQLSKQVKEWREARDCLGKELSKEEDALKEKRKQIRQLQQKEVSFRQKIKAKQAQSRQVFDFNLDLDFTIQKSEAEVLKLKQQRDSLCKTAMTLETFAKSFTNNIQAKQQQLLRARFDNAQLENLLVTKGFQKANLDKEREKSEWESRTFVHHNQYIQQTNDKLKGDFQKLRGHLQTLKRNNKWLGGCIKEYSDTGVKAAKRILQVANK